MTDAAAPQTPAPVPAIATERLSKTYGRHVALKDLDLQVNHGEVFGFLGPNGAGKSTTIRLLLGFLHPTSGSAEILGHDSEAGHIDILRRTGYCPGGPSFDDVLTGRRVLDELGALQRTPPTRRGEICERLQLDDATLGRRVRDYSRGMRQKLGLVQALQHDPDLIILDEPTEGLDPLIQHHFYGLISDFRRQGKTIFFSSHVLSEVERVCDRVAIIRTGTLVATEEIASLLAKRRRHVELRVTGNLPDLSGIPGVSNLAERDGVLTFRLAGQVRSLIDALHGVPVEDLVIEPARLEDVFLEMYGEPAS